MDRHGVELGRWIRERRTRLGLTQEQIAERSEPAIDPNYIAQIENGRKKALPDTDILVGLSMALGVTMTDILRGAGVLPVDVTESEERAPGSQTIHALVDLIDWTVSPENRMNVEGLLRLILDRQRPSSARSGAPTGDRSSR